MILRSPLRNRGFLILIGLVLQVDQDGSSFTLVLLMSEFHQATIVVDETSSCQVYRVLAIFMIVVIVILHAAYGRESIVEADSLTLLQIKTGLTLALEIRLQIGLGRILTSDGGGILQIILHFNDFLLYLGLEIFPGV
jgi:hypothetical protein